MKPTDEEIYKEANRQNELENDKTTFCDGAKWMREQMGEQWTNERVIDLVNWYVDIHGLGVNYKLENQTIIESFLNGDNCSVWQPLPTTQITKTEAK